jgi:N-acetylglucosamine-6-phosphate deacetylase
MIIQSLRVWINQQFIPAQIHLHHHQIIKITPYNETTSDIDYGNHRIVPGFIDTHIHGAYGFDTNDADPEGLKMMMKGLVSEGVTSFCPTTVTQHPNVLNKALKNVANVANEQIQGASIVGIHLEGPFLNSAFKGAQPLEHIIPPSIKQFDEFYASSNNLIKIITMAPELDHDFELVKHCKELNVAVSMGHSGATYDEANLAVAHGASSMTHVFNGMSGLHHRSYNLAGAAHRLSGVYGEIIGDGNHVVWPAIYTLMLAKGPLHNILITDALSVKGHPQGDYELGGQKIEVKADGSAYLKGTNTLSGSTLKMNEGLRNLVEYAQVPMHYAINATSLNPASLLGLSHKKGKIAYQYDADLVVLDDQYQVLATYVMGTCCFKNEGN